MTERERQDFHNSRFIGFLDENCKNTTELVNFDVASVRQCFKYEVVNSNVDVQKRLVEILKAVSLESYIVFNKGYKEMNKKKQKEKKNKENNFIKKLKSLIDIDE